MLDKWEGFICGPQPVFLAKVRQNVLTPDAIIQRIASLQQPSGLFPSARYNATLGYKRADTNVFFTAITVFTLQGLRQMVSAEAGALIDQVGERARMAYPNFQNKDGLATYNFWPTRPSQHFPNGHVFRHFTHFRIPDDIDDTAMVYLTTPQTPDERKWLKTKLTRHANGSQSPTGAIRQIKNTYADYRNLQAYSTWFGKHMPIDFDACALSNLLYWIYASKLPLNRHDADSLTYLRDIVQSGRYRAEPFRCAPHYARTSLIVYHLTRLIAAFDPAELSVIRSTLVADARQLMGAAPNRVEQLLLAISLLRLGESVPAIDLTAIEADFGGFHFFVAGMLTAYEQPILRRWANRPITQMRWQCDAHCWALVAEYAVLVNK